MTTKCLWIAKIVYASISRLELGQRTDTAGLCSFIQAAKGRRSGEVRRKGTAERDAEIVGRVLAGESMTGRPGA